jgi:hypothetical protein
VLLHARPRFFAGQGHASRTTRRCRGVWGHAKEATRRYAPWAALLRTTQQISKAKSQKPKAAEHTSVFGVETQLLAAPLGSPPTELLLKCEDKGWEKTDDSQVLITALIQPPHGRTSPPHSHISTGPPPPCQARPGAGSCTLPRSFTLRSSGKRCRGGPQGSPRAALGGPSHFDQNVSSEAMLTVRSTMASKQESLLDSGSWAPWGMTRMLWSVQNAVSLM